ncbi:MAG: transcriptional regulator, GntR family [candidate division NC10 bacterium]|jgi:DNA-binding GntR family transcriptional regulator|nr:transcriptional regulator, GntR family [candidate division NC10 bacterium]
MDERIRQKSLAEHIVEDLEQKIIAGALPPGQRIIEETLCNVYGVSRSPVREALRILENQRFVVREPRRGISVATITPQEAEQIYQIRASLEGLATALAVQNQTPELLGRLKDLHQQMIRVAEKKNIKTYQGLNQRFHELIINASGSPRLIQLIRSFDKQTMRYRLAVTNAPGWMTKSTEFHAATIASFEVGDAEAAERLRRRAILGQMEQFPKIFTHGEKP